MKEIKEVRLHNNYKYIDVDGFFDNNTDSIGINIAEVWFDGVVWIQPQYKNDTKILKAIEQAKQYLSKGSRLRGDVFKTYDLVMKSLEEE